MIEQLKKLRLMLRRYAKKHAASPPFNRPQLEAANAQFGPLDQWAWDAVARWERRRRLFTRRK